MLLALNLTVVFGFLEDQLLVDFFLVGELDLVGVLGGLVHVRDQSLFPQILEPLEQVLLVFLILLLGLDPALGLDSVF